MAITVDARGLSCPAPVIQTKVALENSPDDTIITIVDNEAAKENVKRLAENLGYGVLIKEENHNYHLTIAKVDRPQDPREKGTGTAVIFVPGDQMGQGSDELGKILIKSYFYALMETKPYPKAILFVNAGVNLTIEGSEVLEHLRRLENAGVEICSCGTCLDFFGLKEKLAVGRVTNMYAIVEQMNTASKVIRI